MTSPTDSAGPFSSPDVRASAMAAGAVQPTSGGGMPPSDPSAGGAQAGMTPPYPKPGTDDEDDPKKPKAANPAAAYGGPSPAVKTV